MNPEVSTVRALVRRPLLHFLLLGALLLGISRVLTPWIEPPAPITVTAADVERLRFSWFTDMKRMPTPAELDTALRHWLDEEILLREALRLGLDRMDGVTRRRLLMNLRFADPDTNLDDETLLREARAMGMSTRDAVVRQRLIDLMEQRIASGLNLSDAEVHGYAAQHPGRYAAEARYTVRQFFFSRDLRHDSAHAGAMYCLQQLRAKSTTNCTADVFLLGSQLSAQTAEDLTRAFGKPVGDRIAGLPPQLWSEPIESPYGWHLFRVESVEAAAELDYAQVRQRAAYALLAERENQAVNQSLEKLRRRYVIRLPENMSLVAP